MSSRTIVSLAASVSSASRVSRLSQLTPLHIERGVGVALASIMVCLSRWRLPWCSRAPRCAVGVGLLQWEQLPLEPITRLAADTIPTHLATELLQDRANTWARLLPLRLGT